MALSNDLTASAIGSKAKRLRELQVAGFCVPEFVCSPGDLSEAMRLLGTPLAVRSSASVEDGRELSFAGQFKSFLNLRTLNEISTAVRQCQESLHAPSVREYCRRHGVAFESMEMGIILQRMIEPELAGVAFTVNPLTGAEEVVIEACEGLADDLLMGRKAALSPNHSLLRRHAPEITKVAKEVQRYFGAPQDIEFAIKKGQLYILQARPITEVSFAPELGSWTNADFRDGGVASTVCTPLMWSLYDFIWERTLKGFLREIKLLDTDFQAGRLFFGRPYWNLGAVKSCLAKLPGFNERKFDEDLSIQPQYEGAGQCTPITIPGVLRALPTVIAVQTIWKNQAHVARRFLNGGFDAVVQEFQDFENTTESLLRRLIEHAYWLVESNYFKTIYCTSLAKLDFCDAFPQADYATLVSGLPHLQHFEPLRAWRAMHSRQEVNVKDFIQRFRHHSRRELDIRAPRWDEDEAWVRTWVTQRPQESGFASQKTYERSRKQALAGLPWFRRRSFTRKLNRLRHFLWLREEMRDLSSRMYYLIRRHTLTLARKRGLGDDIFFMTFEEILTEDRSNIAERRQAYESYRNFKAPNEIGQRWRVTSQPHDAILTGITASRGSALGVARIARSVEEAAAVEPGAILICPFTDPGWTAVLSRVRGVITETGGLLSHAAIICREYGIPALLSVTDATKRIPDRGTIHLRADEGRVELITSATDAEAVCKQSTTYT